MSLAANMKLLGEDMIRSQKERICYLRELKREVRELLYEYHKERALARAIWLRTLETLHKIRMGLIDP